MADGAPSDMNPNDAVLPPLAQPPSYPTWEEALRKNKRILDYLQNQLHFKINVNVLRVNQIDAFRLDSEMTSMLKEQFDKIFALFQPRFVSSLEPELNSLLEFFIFYFTIWKDRPTPGCALMNLRYRNERAYDRAMLVNAVSSASSKSAFSPATQSWIHTGLEGPGLSTTQKIFYGFLTVGLKYILNRSQLLISLYQNSPDSTLGEFFNRLRPIIHHGENLYHLAALVNLFVFLRTSMYSSIVDRLLGARLIYQRPTMSRSVNFEYMNRQLVWNELSELVLLLLPLIHLFSLKNWINVFPSDHEKSKSEMDMKCPICGSNPITISYLALPCKHVFCYYCLRTRCLSNSRFKCPRCNVRVTAMQRYRPEQDINPGMMENESLSQNLP